MPSSDLGYNIATPRPEGLQRRRAPLEDAVRRGRSAACPATRPTPGALHRGGVLGRAGGAPRRLALSAQRQSDRLRQVRLQARLDGAARGARQGAARRRGDLRARRRLQRHSRAERRALPGGTGSTTRCSSRRRAARLPRGSSTSASPTPSAPATASGGHYTFWDYQAGAWQKNNGIRIDHVLLSPQAADRLVRVQIDKRTRSWDKPSDHVPVVIELDV